MYIAGDMVSGMFIETGIIPFEAVGTTKPPGPMWTLAGIGTGTGTIGTALGTSTSNYSRTYQDSNDYKTSGSITVGVVHVEFLNPDMTPYHFHGCDHCINLVFVCEGDQALLSCA